MRNSRSLRAVKSHGRGCKTFDRLLAVQAGEKFLATLHHIRAGGQRIPAV